jgi:hypothetical protein
MMLTVYAVGTRLNHPGLEYKKGEYALLSSYTFLESLKMVPWYDSNCMF